LRHRENVRSDTACRDLKRDLKGGGTWCPLIRSVEQMHSAIAYVERNRVKVGLRPQRWSVVTP